MKVKLEDFKVCVLHNGVTSNTADQSCTEIDIGTCRRGILLIDCIPEDATSDLSDVFLTTDKEATLTASDDVVPLTQGIYYLDSAPTAPVALTIASDAAAAYVFQGIEYGATYMIQCENLERYVQMWYDGKGTTIDFTAILLAYDGQESPQAAARSAY